jgi:hypothetical protein
MENNKVAKTDSDKAQSVVEPAGEHSFRFGEVNKKREFRGKWVHVFDDYLISQVYHK